MNSNKSIIDTLIKISDHELMFRFYRKSNRASSLSIIEADYELFESSKMLQCVIRYQLTICLNETLNIAPEFSVNRLLNNLKLMKSNRHEFENRITNWFGYNNTSPTMYLSVGMYKLFDEQSYPRLGSFELSELPDNSECNDF